MLELVCMSLDRGLVEVRLQNGEKVYYSLRGINKLRPDEKSYAIESDLIRPDAFLVPEIPKGVKLKYFGKASGPRVTFDKKLLYR